jgi:hypothetical protein
LEVALKKKSGINQAAVKAFSKKLEEWSKTLPTAERDLVRLLVERATTVNVADLGPYDLKAKVRPDAERLFKSLRKATGRARKRRRATIEFGDLWLRSIITRPG